VVALSSEYEKLQKQHEQAQEDEKAGPIEREFLLYLQNEIGMVSKCWHGGDYEGNGIFSFLGKKGYGKKTDKKRKDYTHAIAQLKQTIQREYKAHTDWCIDMVYTVNYQSLPALDKAILPTLSKLVGVADYIMMNRKLSDEEIQEGNKLCVEYVQFYRKTYAQNKDEIQDILGKVNIRPKHHLLESHVPKFALKWKSVGMFSESAVETYHADVNKLQGRWSCVTRFEQYFQLCDDEGNARFLEAAKSKGKVSPAPALAKSSQQQKNATAPGTNDVGEGSPRTSQNLPLSPERAPRTKKRKEAKEGQ